ncbi:MAG TPA: 4-alpha-glucanotransferase [Acidimicrobiales bacterium]|jgi:4-alpha-glucanotransferase|nr:4-alpha-glucanotransferase [Acidimicrobiales bacterium]
MPDLEAWGISPGYHDVSGQWREPPPRTIEAITTAMSIDSDKPKPGPPLWIVQAGDEVTLGGRWELQPDGDAGSEVVSGTLPSLEPGYYRAFHDDGRGLRLIVTPGRCHMPADLRIWGWAVQLYAMRSKASWGIGDLGDLSRFGSWARDQGAELVLLNPLHASTPVEEQQESPYYPSSRCFRNPLFLRIEDVPGADFLGGELEAIAARGRALNDDRRIDRPEVFRLKLDALNRIFAAVPPGDGFDAFVDDGGELLARYATHCVLAETYGPNWREWPADLRDPASFESRQVRDEQKGRVRFHMWLQWLVDQQLQRAGQTIGLMQDLAIGVDPGGADAWMWQHVLAPDMSVGAPPDEYNTQGQDWGLPPFDPWKLRDDCYEPFIQTVRAGFRHAGGLRFDHVMGLFRLFWVPNGSSAREGTYVRYPYGDLLDILAVESYRAGAYVVGEDLGTVEDYMRDELGKREILSYRLFWFEPGPPRDFPDHALGAVTTHDLPTIAGLWTGSDIDAQRERDMEPNVDSTEELHRKVESMTGLAADAPVAEVVRRVHELLAEAPCRIVTATLDDALGVEERPNYPGTTGGTNWSMALPVPLDDIVSHDGVQEVARILREQR